jgi:site-specific DNA recombinase
MRAFEQGELDAKTCASRTNAIQVKLGLLRNRREDLKHLLEQMPGQPSAKAVTQIRRALKHVFAHGTAAQRKAMIEATVAEIKFEGTSLIPVFKVPEEATRPVAKTGLSGEVRAMEPVVRRQGLEPRTRGLRVRCSAS